MMIPSDNITSSVPEEEPSIDLRQYLTLFMQWWWLVALVTLVTGALAYFLSSQMTPVFQSSTTLLINQAPANRTASYDTLMTSQLLAKTYAQMITTRPVLEKTIQRLGINMSPEDLGDMITVTPVRDTQLITISVEGQDTNMNAALANSLVLVFAEELRDKQSTRFADSRDSLQSQIAEVDNQIVETRSALEAATDPLERDRLETRLNQYEQTYANLVMSYEDVRLAEAQTSSNVAQIEYAVVSTEPVRPQPLRNGLLAAVVGMMLSVGGIFAYDAFDDTVKSPDEINRQLHLPVMGMIGKYEEPQDGQLITRAQPRSPVAESFRALRTNVQYASVSTPLQKLLITSPAPGDGKTTVSSNLALVMAQGGRRVTIIDADLHRPRVHRVFGTEQRPGLSALFIKPTVRLNGSLQPTPLDRLRVVGAGDLPPNPSELLGSKKMLEIMDAVLEQSDVMILDTPPVLSVTDAVVLAPKVDGVLIVVRPGVTKMSALKAAVEQLRYVGANIAGVVLNSIDNKKSRYGYYYKNYYYKQYRYYKTNGRAPKNESQNRPQDSWWDRQDEYQEEYRVDER